jgi:C2H2 transcription facotor
VHVNEDIPIDSLAATGARFQRQVRTDRVRPPGVRSRAATSGSQAGPIRGHQRNSLSASSIASVGSIGSAYSLRDDARRRPAPLVMAGANRHSAEMMYHPDSPGNYPFRARSPVGFSTPTSATFSAGQNSPRWPPGLQSPISSHSRTQSLYSAPRTPGRRLSVPSAGYPYQSPRGGSYGQHPVSLNSPMTSSPGSILSSPTSIWSRRDSTSSATDETYKRKTWAHPETYSSFASRLQNPISTHYPSPGPPPRGALEQSNGPSEQGRMRLPGIESFDSIPRSATPVQRQPSPMVIDTPSRAPIPSSEPYREGVRDTQPWEMGAPRYPDRLDIGRGSSSSNDSAAAWASEANWAVQARAEQARAPPSQVRFEESSYLERTQRVYQHQSAPVVTPREAKRQAWYHGPVSAHHQQPPVDPQLQRTSPEGSSSSDGVPGTPSSTNARDSNPSIMHSNGYVESRDSYPVHDPRSGSTHDLSGYANYPPTNGPDASYTYAHGHQAPQVEPQHQVPKASDSSMLRLEALVAVATSEENVAAAAY